MLIGVTISDFLFIVADHRKEGGDSSRDDTVYQEGTIKQFIDCVLFPLALHQSEEWQSKLEFLRNQQLSQPWLCKESVFGNCRF